MGMEMEVWGSNITNDKRLKNGSTLFLHISIFIKASVDDFRANLQSSDG